MSVELESDASDDEQTREELQRMFAKLPDHWLRLDDGACCISLSGRRASKLRLGRDNRSGCRRTLASYCCPDEEEPAPPLAAAPRPHSPTSQQLVRQLRGDAPTAPRAIDATLPVRSEPLASTPAALRGPSATSTPLAATEPAGSGQDTVQAQAQLAVLCQAQRRRIDELQREAEAVNARHVAELHALEAAMHTEFERARALFDDEMRQLRAQLHAVTAERDELRGGHGDGATAELQEMIAQKDQIIALLQDEFDAEHALRTKLDGQCCELSQRLAEVHVQAKLDSSDDSGFREQHSAEVAALQDQVSELTQQLAELSMFVASADQPATASPPTCHDRDVRAAMPVDRRLTARQSLGIDTSDVDDRLELQSLRACIAELSRFSECRAADFTARQTEMEARMGDSCAPTDLAQRVEAELRLAVRRLESENHSLQAQLTARRRSDGKPQVGALQFALFPMPSRCRGVTRARACRRATARGAWPTSSTTTACSSGAGPD